MNVNLSLLPLAQLPALTPLTIYFGFFESLQVLPPLPRLRKFELVSPTFSKLSWLPLWTASSGLEEVELHCLQWQYDAPIPVEDFAESFRALKSMHTLTLEYVSQCDLLVSHVHHASNLRRLDITMYCRDEITVPAPVVLQHLMKALPALTVRVNLRNREFTVADHSLTLDRQSRYAELQSSMGTRLLIELTGLSGEIGVHNRHPMGWIEFEG